MGRAGNQRGTAGSKPDRPIRRTGSIGANHSAAKFHRQTIQSRRVRKSRQALAIRARLDGSTATVPHVEQLGLPVRQQPHHARRTPKLRDERGHPLRPPPRDMLMRGGSAIPHLLRGLREHQRHSRQRKRRRRRPPRPMLARLARSPHRHGHSKRQRRTALQTPRGIPRSLHDRRRTRAHPTQPRSYPTRPRTLTVRRL